MREWRQVRSPRSAWRASPRNSGNHLLVFPAWIPHLLANSGCIGPAIPTTFPWCRENVMGSAPHAECPPCASLVLHAYYPVMKQEPANTPLPTTDVDDTRIDLDRLESEAQTHDCPRNDTAKDKSVVSGGNATREEAGKL